MILKELALELEKEKKKAILCFVDGDKIEYHYTNMGAGMALDVLTEVKKCIFNKISESIKAEKA